MSAVQRVLLSNDLTRHTIRAASAAKSASKTLKDMADAYEVMTVGPKQAVKNAKPKKTLLMTLAQARHLYKGE